MYVLVLNFASTFVCLFLVFLFSFLFRGSLDTHQKLILIILLLPFEGLLLPFEGFSNTF